MYPASGAWAVHRRAAEDIEFDFMALAVANVEALSPANILIPPPMEVLDFDVQWWTGTEWNPSGPGQRWSTLSARPPAIKVTLTLRDSEGNAYDFETVVELPDVEY